VDRFVLPSTDGPVEHVKVLCARRHWFLLLAQQCPGTTPAQATSSALGR